MADLDPGHQFQMLLKPLANALRQGNVEAALRVAGHLLDVGGGPAEFEVRKVHFLVKAMEGASPDVKTAFTAKLLERFGPVLSADARSRLEGRLDRL